MDKIAVLIPCYNEEKTIEKVIRDAKAALPEAQLVVDARCVASNDDKANEEALDMLQSVQVEVVG